MRRFFLYLLIAMLAFGALRVIRSRPRPTHYYGPRPPAAPRPHEDAARRHRELAAEARRQAQQAAAEARRAMEEAGREEIRQAYHEAKAEIGQAYREAREEIRQTYREMVADNDGRPPLPPSPPPAPHPVPALEEADGLPVPIVPGTRVTEAEAKPPAPPVRPVAARLASQSRPLAPAAASCDTAAECGDMPTANAQFRVPFVGDICATEERARADARKALEVGVAKWLEPDVPAAGLSRSHGPDGRPIGSIRASWTPPAGLLQALVVETKIDPYISRTDKGVGPLYIATMTADLSPHRRAELVDAYNHELVQHRLFTLGGSLGFVLICLAAISGYIRADEATKGYYTNRLRMLAAAGVGAAGVIVYKMLA